MASFPDWASPYSCLKLLSRGPLSDVWLVRRDDDPAKLYVLKEFRSGSVEAPNPADEAELLGSQQHPFILPLVEVMRDAQGGPAALVTEYCDRGDLHSQLSDVRRQGKVLPDRQILSWLGQLCLALRHLHRQRVLHRDVKSSNIFVCADGTLKLGDFGLARAMKQQQEALHSRVGSILYVSPEICNNSPYGPASDVWSLGCVLYEMATLSHAFRAENAVAIVQRICAGAYTPPPPSCSEPIRALIGAMLQLDPAARPSVDQLLRNPALVHVLPNLLPPAPPPAALCSRLSSGSAAAIELLRPPPTAAARAAAGSPLARVVCGAGGGAAGDGGALPSSSPSAAAADIAPSTPAAELPPSAAWATARRPLSPSEEYVRAFGDDGAGAVSAAASAELPSSGAAAAASAIASAATAAASSVSSASVAAAPEGDTAAADGTDAANGVGSGGAGASAESGGGGSGGAAEAERAPELSLLERGLMLFRFGPFAPMASQRGPAQPPSQPSSSLLESETAACDTEAKAATDAGYDGANRSGAGAEAAAMLQAMDAYLASCLGEALLDKALSSPPSEVPALVPAAHVAAVQALTQWRAQQATF